MKTTIKKYIDFNNFKNYRTLLRTTGIYGIKSRLNGKWYIGQAQDIYSRIRTHFYEFKKQIHYNAYLQNHYNKHGFDDLRLYILIECEEFQLDYHEKNLIKEYKSFGEGFNLNEGGKGNKKYTISGKLKNIITGEIEEFKNLKDFCFKYDLNYRNAISVMRGVLNCIDIWYNPDNSWEPTFYELEDTNGNIERFFSQKDFLQKYNLKKSSLFKLLSGKYKYYKGWKIPNSNNKSIKRSKYFFDCYVVSPFGESCYIGNLNDFCKKYNLNKVRLSLVLHKKHEHYKGWRLENDDNKGKAYNFYSKIFYVIDPNENIHIFGNIVQFAKKHNLNSSNLNAVITGRRETVNGWRLKL